MGSGARELDSNTSPKVMIVEDDPAQLEVLDYNFSCEGMKVISETRGDRAVKLFDSEQPDIAVLDWMLPGLSGLELCRYIKTVEKNAPTPVIMISARVEEDDRIKGLENGADDYVVKPYSVAELIARVRVNLRRVRPATVASQLRHGDIVMNIDTHRVLRDGKSVDLGPTEYRLLAEFLERPGHVLSRERLLKRVWGRNIHVEERTVDVHVGRLRKALCQFGGPDPFRTVRGAGYALR